MRAAGVSGTRVSGEERTGRQTLKELEEQLGRGKKFVEYVVAKPQVAGIYVPDNQGAYQGWKEGGADSRNPIHSYSLAREVSKVARELGIPVYVRQERGTDDKFYKAGYDMHTGKLVAGEPISH
jgi:hypothetical protein